MNDVTADIRKEDDVWNVLVTIFLEVTRRENEEDGEVACHVASTLHISQSDGISNAKEIVLRSSNGRYANVNVSLVVPAVSISQIVSFC